MTPPSSPGQRPHAHSVHALPNVYPNELASAEDRLIAAKDGGRRAQAGVPEKAPRAGLALSGGGIRSATFNLGLMQALARQRLLRRFDFLSTVSGGGYIGSFVGAWIHREGIDTVERELPNSRSFPVRFLRENGHYLAPNGAGDALVALASHLRGWVTVLVTLGIFALGWLLLAAAAHEWAWIHKAGDTWPEWICRPGVARWWWLSPWWCVAGAAVVGLVVPTGAAFWLLGSRPLRLPVVFWLLVMALLGAAAFTGTEGRVALLGTALGLSLVGATAYFVSARRGANLTVLRRLLSVFGVTALLALAYFFIGGFRWVAPWDSGLMALPQMFEWVLRTLGVEIPVGHVVRELGAVAMLVGGAVWVAAFSIAARYNELNRARRMLNEWLAGALGGTGLLVVLAMVDTLGGTWFAASGDVRSGHAIVTCILIAGIWIAVQWTGPRLMARLADDHRASLPATLLAGLAAAGVALALLGILNSWAHAIAAALGAGFTGGHSLHAARDLALAGAGVLLLCACFGRSRTILNLTSNLQVYTSRITRTYLGASNRLRRDPNHGGVTKPVVDDDFAFTGYHPERKGGPLHLVNVTVNETVLGKSGLEQRARRGFSLAVGPGAMSVGRTNHALMQEDTASPVEQLEEGMLAGFNGAVHSVQVAAERVHSYAASAPYTAPPFIPTPRRVITRASLEPVAGRPGEFHPLARTTEQPFQRHGAEMLTLGRWLGVSGAAFSTGLGQRTSIGLSFLAGIFNVRLGFWWDSEIAPLSRRGNVPHDLVALAGVCTAAVFPVQSHLLDELFGRFQGPAARRFWYLSDGGHFENTAAYELIRRRVALIVVGDCGADSDYSFEDAGNLVRKARIDFGAEIRFCDRARLDALLPGASRTAIGPLAELGLQPAVGGGFRRNGCHAALAEVFYDGSDRPGSVLLLVKPSLTGDEPIDILNYHSEHPSFPQESTLNQFFDEAQWESYCRLGELIGTEIFGDNGAALDLAAVLERMRTPPTGGGPGAN